MTAGWLDISVQYNAANGLGRASRPKSLGLARNLAVLLAEAIDATLRIDQALLARVEGVTGAAHVGTELLSGRPRLERVATGTGHRDELVIGMNAVFHGALGFVGRAT